MQDLGSFFHCASVLALLAQYGALANHPTIVSVVPDVEKVAPPPRHSIDSTFDHPFFSHLFNLHRRSVKSSKEVETPVPRFDSDETADMLDDDPFFPFLMPHMMFRSRPSAYLSHRTIAKRLDAAKKSENDVPNLLPQSEQDAEDIFLDSKHTSGHGEIFHRAHPRMMVSIIRIVAIPKGNLTKDNTTSVEPLDATSNSTLAKESPEKSVNVTGPVIHASTIRLSRPISGLDRSSMLFPLLFSLLPRMMSEAMRAPIEVVNTTETANNTAAAEVINTRTSDDKSIKLDAPAAAAPVLVVEKPKTVLPALSAEVKPTVEVKPIVEDKPKAGIVKKLVAAVETTVKRTAAADLKVAPAKSVPVPSKATLTQSLFG